MVYVPDAVVDHRVFEQRLGWDYYMRWQRGFGRSRVIIRPPRGPLDRARIIVRDTGKLLANLARVAWA